MSKPKNLCNGNSNCMNCSNGHCPDNVDVKKDLVLDQDDSVGGASDVDSGVVLAVQDEEGLKEGVEATG